MKAFKIMLCFVLILCFAACNKSEFMDLSGFIHSYNEMAEKELSFLDFSFKERDSRTYNAVLGEKGKEVLLSLREENEGEIFQCKTFIIKVDSQGQANSITAEHIKSFVDILENTICAFCVMGESEAKKLMEEFSLYDESTYKKEGELTKQQGDFYFVYYSTSLMSQMTIYNTHLYEIQATEKPVSRPAYGDTTKVIDG